jgi:hypothetical protein
MVRVYCMARFQQMRLAAATQQRCEGVVPEVRMKNLGNRSVWMGAWAKLPEPDNHPRRLILDVSSICIYLIYSHRPKL